MAAKVNVPGSGVPGGAPVGLVKSEVPIGRHWSDSLLGVPVSGQEAESYPPVLRIWPVSAKVWATLPIVSVT